MNAAPVVDLAAERRSLALASSNADGRVDAMRVIAAVPHARAELISEAITRIASLRDPDRLASFSRTLARALAAA